MIPSMELPLVGFTVLSQTAVGLTLVYALQGALQGADASGAGEASPRTKWLAAAGILALGLLV
ncbi:hypothetical protein dsx2_3441, partial [Desulfovibrio sp. X2]